MRYFLPKDLKLTNWKQIEFYYELLLNRNINSLQDLTRFLKDRSELDSFLDEDMAWRYINMNKNTSDLNLKTSFHFFVEEIAPNITSYNHKLNLKVYNSFFIDQLDLKLYFTYLRSLKNQIDLYCEKNITLLTELKSIAQKYGEISSQMTIHYDGKELTLQEASVKLKDTDRKIRKDVFEKIITRRMKDSKILDQLLDTLIDKRRIVSDNLGFNNFRDYKFKSMGRFDYTKEDCFNFHSSIEKEIVPLIKEIHEQRKSDLGINKLRPWDMEVDTNGYSPLKLFDGADDLLDKCISCFEAIRPYYGDCLRKMKEIGHLDLVSRKGKAPGGFMYPLHETGVPFIFMNSVGLLQDIVTFIHEGGHAVHSFFTKEMDLIAFKNTPSEVSELASMTMELISMEHWDIFINSKEDLIRARKEQLYRILFILPWVAMVDEFQHWLYENPNHTHTQRHDQWLFISKKYDSNSVDWTSYESSQKILWQNQLHIYEVPFYYIEYGMAQLGAIALWRKYKQSSEEALNAFDSALKLGYTKTIGEIYAQAGIKFDFSTSYVRELSSFVKKELNQLK